MARSCGVGLGTCVLGRPANDDGARSFHNAPFATAEAFSKCMTARFAKWPPVVVVRAWILFWRTLCRIYTRLRHPLLAGRPALLLRYETQAQKEAYAGINVFPCLGVARQHRVLVVIPFRDRWDLTEQALQSLSRQRLDGVALMVALVDNGSVEATTRQGIACWMHTELGDMRVRHLRYDEPFNFSRLNNRAVYECADFAPDHVLFLNNDVEVVSRDAVGTLCAFLEANLSCGAVGCTLIYPDLRIQHLFISVGCKVVGSHPFKGSRLNQDDPWMKKPRPVPAVTGALLMMRCAVFVGSGGFAEEYPSYQDVDLALRIRKSGYSSWVLPHILAIHRETQCRTKVIPWEEVGRFQKEWGDYIHRSGLFPNVFSSWSEQPVLTLGEGRYPLLPSIRSLR